MSHIPTSLRKLIIRRAGNRCEYCQLSQEGQEASFHIDHIDPIANGGLTEASTLALACVSCSLRKGSKSFAVDPESGNIVRIFDPRVQEWKDHFRWRGFRIRGISDCGRATVKLLKINRPTIVAIRGEEYLLGRHPQDSG